MRAGSWLSSWHVVAMALVAGLAPAASGQGREPKPEQSFSAATELVSVDVLVFDRDGQPVRGLGKADFEILENGRPQAVSSFEAVDILESEARPAPRTRVSTNLEANRRPERSFVVIFDDVNISPLVLPRARKAMEEFLETGLSPGDVVTVLPTSGGAWWTATLPEGRQGLLEFVGSLESKFRPDNSVAAISDYEALLLHYGRDPQVMSQVLRRYYENGVLQEFTTNNESKRSLAELDVSPGAGIVKARAGDVYRSYTTRVERTLGTFERVAQALRQARGRKTVLFVSEGFVYDGTQPGFREVVRLARDANAAFYFVDARGKLGAPGAPGAPGATAEYGRDVLTQDTLSTLANPRQESGGAESVALDTGGFSIRNTDNLAAQMTKVARESRAYYLLGYVPSDARRDGKFRKIEVRVGRPDVKVRARRGYYAPSDKDDRPPRADELDPRVRAGLDAPEGVAGLPLRLVAHGLGPVAPGKSAALVVADIDLRALDLPEDESHLRQAALETYAVVASTGGEISSQEKLVELSLPPEAWSRVRAAGLPVYRQFELAPGDYQVRFLVRDRRSGRVGSVHHDFTVPDPSTFGLSTPILTDQLQPAGPQGPARPVPVARRSFKSGSQLYYAFEVFGAQRDPVSGPRVTTSYVVRSADGREVTRSDAQPIQAAPQGPVSQLLALSLQGLPAGDYSLDLVVKDQLAGRQAEVNDGFAVED